MVKYEHTAQQPIDGSEEDAASKITELEVANSPNASSPVFDRWQSRNPPISAAHRSMKRSIDSKSSTSVQALKSKIAETETQLSDTIRQISELPLCPTQAVPTSTSSDLQFRGVQVELTDNDQAALSYSNHVFSRHISLLKKYNEIKDITQGMLSIIAEKEGRRMAEIMEEYGLDEKD
ncbi:Swi5-domain-containing protein [Exophiala viscosa]|uniref:Swi5-domain-containing protein n=1 Tax=Exophiala viscosa TaxID=2486360 RepID=A0AAN6DSP5_9EURO|nr:Swi5-domain-containing protein [Exophiala viscosa]